MRICTHTEPKCCKYLNTCVHMYACMFVCMFVCLCVYTAIVYVMPHACMHVCGCISTLIYYAGLTDKVLESVVAKGSGELLSLDLSAVPHLLTDHALSVIGQCMLPWQNVMPLIKHTYRYHISMYICT